MGRDAPPGDAGCSTPSKRRCRRSCRRSRRTIGSPRAPTTRRRPATRSRSTTISRPSPARRNRRTVDAFRVSAALVAGGSPRGGDRRGRLRRVPAAAVAADAACSAACWSAFACSRSPRWCCSCSARSPSCRRPARATRSCRSSSTSRAACGSPTRTGRPAWRARTALLKAELGLPLTSHFKTEIYGVGDGLAPAKIDGFAADARRTDLVRRARRRCASAIAVSASPGSSCISDGGDTGAGRADAARSAGGQGAPGRAVADAGGPPVFAIGVGSPDGPRDREVLGHHRRRSAARSRDASICTSPRSAAASAARRSRCACSPTASCWTRAGSCRRPMARRSSRCSPSRRIR